MKSQLLNVIASRVGKFAACLTLGLGVVTLSQTARADYASSVLNDSPLAFWKLDEVGDPSSGTLPAADSAGHGYAGTYGTTSELGIFTGPASPYAGFSGSESSVIVGTSADPNSVITIPNLNFNTNTVTIAMWIAPAAGESTYAGLLMNRTSAGDAAGFGFGGTTNSDGMAALGYTWNENAANTYGFSSKLYPLVPVGGAPVWQFVALVINSNSATIYLYYNSGGQDHLLSAVNNIAHTTETFSGGFTALGSDVVNGASPDPTRVFYGAISDASVFNQALTPDQILALYAAGRGVAGFAPQITGQPSSVAAATGASASFSATGINGSSPIDVHWEKDGTPVSSLSDSANFVGATNSTLQILSVSAIDTGNYVLVAHNAYGTTPSSPATLSLKTPALVGEWLDGSVAGTNLLDVSGYSLAGMHGAYPLGGGAYRFTNDVPPGKTGYSIVLSPNGTSGLAISNSSSLDANYDGTFDSQLNNSFTVAVWSKGLNLGSGWPTTWSPWVSKYGDFVTYPDYSSTSGWQLRVYGSSQYACFTLRDLNVGVNVLGGIGGDDMGASLSPTEDGSWHFYVGTFDGSTGVRDLYIDGRLAAENTNDAPYIPAPEVHLCIGSKDNPPGNSFGNYSTNLPIYDVRIYNYALTSNQIVTIYGNVGAKITGQPGNVLSIVGNKGTFIVGETGTPPLTNQWTLNGTNIDQLFDATNFTGANSSVLSVLSTSFNDQGSYKLYVSNAYGSDTSSVAKLFVIQPALVGEWFTNASLADISGYTPAGTHDGYNIGNAGGSYSFTNDVPPGKTGMSLYLYNDGIAISNSSTNDANYTNTFDNNIAGAMTVACWARGWPGGWNPWVSKYGEGPGWQLRNDGNNNVSPCWTIRGTGGKTVNVGTNITTAVYGNSDDMAATSLTYGNDGEWHCYVGTYNAGTGIRDLYVDGVLVAQETGNNAYNQAPFSHLAIGAKDDTAAYTTPGFGNFFTGEIYDVRIANYDWTAGQVAQYAGVPDPTILGQPPGAVTIYVGSTRTITVGGIKGSGPITNQWQLNGTNLVSGSYGGGYMLGATSISSVSPASSTLTLANVTANFQGVYRLVVSDAAGTLTSSNATVTVAATAPPPAGNLVGSWLTGAANLTDTSGYSPAGTHDGYGVSGTNTLTTTGYVFTNDVPTGYTGEALSLPGTIGIAISNSSTNDAGYTDTFDDVITNAITVMCWAKGVPGGWNPFVSKFGETEAGWQLRVNGSADPTWSMRGAGGTDDMASSTATEGTKWHFYAGTFDLATGIRDLYVDGALVATETTTNGYITATGEHLAIGAKDSPPGGNFGNYFNGEIYGVRIYNAALSAAQVNSFMPTNTYTAGSPVFNAPPVVTGGKVVLTWGSGSLLEATNITGPWSPVNAATSPYTNTITGPQMFFKLQ